MLHIILLRLCVFLPCSLLCVSGQVRLVRAGKTRKRITEEMKRISEEVREKTAILSRARLAKDWLHIKSERSRSHSPSVIRKEESSSSASPSLSPSREPKPRSKIRSSREQIEAGAHLLQTKLDNFRLKMAQGAKSAKMEMPKMDVMRKSSTLPRQPKKSKKMVIPHSHSQDLEDRSVLSDTIESSPKHFTGMSVTCPHTCYK